MILPLLTTTAVVLLPEQVVPTETTTHAPSKLPAPPPPPPPPLRREVDRRGSSSGLLRGAGRSGSTDREPDSDFSSLPMLPPPLPDCASATFAVAAKARKANPIPYRMIFCIWAWFPNHCRRPEPSAQTAPIIRQDLPALPHSSS